MAGAYDTKLWGGRFCEQEDALMERFNNNFEQTVWLCEPDIEGSIAHVAMLVKVGLLTPAEGETLTKGLQGILADVRSGALPLTGDYEDVHTFVEINLVHRVGEVGKKLHTARSRNDQVNLDMKLYVRQKAKECAQAVQALRAVLAQKAAENPCIMPGYTHLQRAQVITFGYQLMAYHGMLGRDEKRLLNALDNLDESPLGCGALAGTTHDIDRRFTAQQLGFGGVYANFIDGVSDRDYCLEVMGALAILMMHLSRMAEELVLWSSQEFGFITLDDRYTTGSSIMPQKKNSDAAELVRGRTGRVYGNLMALLTVMKGLPLAYNKDLQEDKPLFYESMETALSCLALTQRMVATLTVHADAMHRAVKKGFLNATEVADYLVRKGVAFRDAHGIVGRIVLYCEEQGKAIEELTLGELQRFSPAIGEDVYGFIDYDAILRKGNKKEMLNPGKTE